MTSDPPTRVLLTLDCGAIDSDAFRVLTLVTGDGGVEVTGLYIQDEDVYDAARLPGMTEVSLHNGSVATLNPARINEQIASQARRAQEDFELAARRMKINSSFQVVRGRSVDIMLKAASTSDFVVVTRSLRASGLRARQATHFEPLVQQHQNLLFVNEPWASGRSVVVLCEAHPDEYARILTTARRIADAENISLIIAVPQHRADARYEIAENVVILSSWTEHAIVDLCETEDARLLVLPPTADLDWRTLLLRLIDRVSCSLLKLD